MRNVIKNKLHSALCDEDQVEKFNKAMYIGKRVVFDKEEGEQIMIDDPSCGERTHHPDIQPAATRIQNYKHKTFGKKYTDAVDSVKQND